MVKKILKWISEIFASMPQPRGFCYWCHKNDCPHPDYESCKNKRFQCEYHPEVKDGSAPSFCHRCSYGWDHKRTWVKPTIYKPDPNRYDSRWCLDWICESCDKQDKERKELWEKQHHNTVEAAMLAFTQKDGIFYYSYVPIEADFNVTYESLAPFVIGIIDASENWFNDGINFDAVIIRDGRIYTRDYRQEWEWEEDWKENV